MPAWSDAFLVVVDRWCSLLAFVVAVDRAGHERRPADDQIGRGGLSLDGPPPAPPPGEREAEIRQMLEARNARRAARGEPPVDVEAELRALTRARPPTRRCAAEVRELVEARNARARRARASRRSTSRPRSSASSASC